MILKNVLRILPAVLMFSGVSMSNEYEQTNNTVDRLSQNFEIMPVKMLNLRTYFFSTDYPHKKYLLPNSDGDFINRGFTPILSIEGYGKIFTHLLINYKIQGNTNAKFTLKNLFVRYDNRSISLGIGKANTWLGHGRHGSLLLSNNSEPYRMIKFQTEKPFRIPYIGRFTYLMLHGWTEDFKILAHRFSWFPISWLEFGGTQTVQYQRNYKLLEFFKILSAAEENLPGRYNNEQRAGLDLAIHLPFVKMFPPLKNAKIYFEYAGEDIGAWWQEEDKVWIGPLGFEFYDPALSAGIFLESEKGEFHAEYSQNYKITNLFHKVHTGLSYQEYTKKWYSNLPFVNYGSMMGHHMGREADNLYVEYKHYFNENYIKIFVDKERHGLASGNGSVYKLNDYPEHFLQIGTEYRHVLNNYFLVFLIAYNKYENVSYYPRILDIVPVKGTTARELLVGISISYQFN